MLAEFFVPLCIVSPFLLLMIVIDTDKKSKKENNSSTNKPKQEHKKVNKTKSWKNTFNNFYKSQDENVEYYEVGFAYKPAEAWIYAKLSKKENKITYRYVNINDDETGTINFKDGSYPRMVLDECLMNYTRNGRLNFDFTDNRAIFIISDIIVREDYEFFTIKRTYETYEKVRNYWKNDNSSYNNSYNRSSSNASEHKTKIVNSFKYFGFNKVVTFEEVRIAYKRMAMTYHPDKGGTVEKMQEINEKYDILKGYFKK